MQQGMQLIRVTGMDGAKAYQMPPNSVVLSIETIEEEILNLEKRDTSYAVCERLAWLYIVRDHLKKPTVDATVMEQRITDELTGSEFLKAASNVDYAALMGVLDNHMSCIKAVCPKEYDAVMSQIHALR